MKEYEQPDKLRAILDSLKGRKFVLDCGHRITFSHHLGNNIIIYNGKHLVIVCTLCGY